MKKILLIVLSFPITLVLYIVLFSNSIKYSEEIIINENIILSENIYNTTFDGFMKGSSSFEDAINANNALYDNLDLKARLEKVRIEQRINLILALGGGFNITND